MTACDACLRRTELLALLGAHVERARHERRRLGELLALADDDLLRALAGQRREEILRALERFTPPAARERAGAADLALVCRHAGEYPERLRGLADAPAVLHVAGRTSVLGGLDGVPTVAVVGARRAGPDGLEIARALGRGLAVAGVAVVSGMALGIDSAAHGGALDGGGRTVAVLAGGADVIYPRSKHRLYGAILTAGCAVSEMPPGFAPFRWCFPARNRTIAGLADLTVVVEAAERSGSLITAELAQDLGRAVGAVPGSVTSPHAAGTNALLRDGAVVIRGAQDALDEVLGVGVARVETAVTSGLEPALLRLLDRVGAGEDTVARLVRTPDEVDVAMTGLAELELRGLVRREGAGRYVRVL